MTGVTKNKLLTWAVLLLLAANIVTVYAFWSERARRSQIAMPPDRFLIKELYFDKNQEEKYRQMVEEHQRRAFELIKHIRESKDQFFKLMQQPQVTDSTKKASAMAISQFTQQLDILTFEHFQAVRANCTPEQQKKFDDIIQNVLRRMGREGPGNGPPPPPDGLPPQ